MNPPAGNTRASLYDLFGVPSTVSQGELRRAFLRLARRYHPDANVTADARTRQEAEARMRLLNEAWAVLGDAERRADYDRELARAEARVHARRMAAAAAASARPPGARRATSTGEAQAGSAGQAAPAGAPRVAARQDEGAAEWRRYASPGSATDRSLLARSFTLIPAGLLAGALALLVVGSVMQTAFLLSLAAVVAVIAALAFVAAPLLAMKEARRAQQRQRAARSKAA